MLAGDETVHPWMRTSLPALPGQPAERCAAPPFAGAVRCHFARWPWKLDGTYSRSWAPAAALSESIQQFAASIAIRVVLPEGMMRFRGDETGEAILSHAS